MRGEHWLLRLGDFLVRAAATRLPKRVRDDRYREWAAELPVILHDPDGGIWPRRAGQMLGYALDTIRGSALGAAQARHRGLSVRSRLGIAWLLVLVIASVLSLFYDGFSRSGVASWAFSWLLYGAMLVTFAVLRRGARDRTSLTLMIVWLTSSLVSASGHIALAAAQQAGWPASRMGPVRLASSVADTVWVIATVMWIVATAWIAIRRRSRRPAPGSPPERGSNLPP